MVVHQFCTDAPWCITDAEFCIDAPFAHVWTPGDTRVVWRLHFTPHRALRPMFGSFQNRR
jgi:hypothetical protein